MNPLSSAPVTAGAVNKTVETSSLNNVTLESPAADGAARKRSHSVFAGAAAVLAGVYLVGTSTSDRKVYCSEPQSTERARRLCGQAQQDEKQGARLIRAGLDEMEGVSEEMRAAAKSRNAFFRSNGIHYNDAASRAALTSLRLRTGGFGDAGWGRSFGGG